MPKPKPFDEKTIKMLEEIARRRVKRGEQQAAAEKALREFEEKLSAVSDSPLKVLATLNIETARTVNALARQVADFEVLVYTLALRMKTEFGGDTEEEDSSA